MSIVNWDNFNILFDDCRHEFEYFAYQLFCYEFGQKYGIYRFYNQPYIETEPIIFKNDYIGFQAKYYDAGTLLSNRKSELIEAIKQSSEKYPGINRFIIYTNKEFGASNDTNNTQPKAKEEIETAGQMLAISVEWRMQSHFEIMALKKDLSAVFDYFFNPNKGIRDFLKKIEEHKISILHSINSNIIYNEKTYKLNRPTIDIDKLLHNKQNTMLVYGEGGTGKSAIVKDALTSRKDVRYFVFTATDFDVPSMADVSFRFGTGTMEEFCAAFLNQTSKVCVIESAENILNAKRTIIFTEFYNMLIKYQWKVIFTIRSAYVERFINDVIYNSENIYFEVKKLSPEEIKIFAENNGITLPQNKNVLDYITNLFYLSMYIKTISAEKSNSLFDFLNKIWDIVICKKDSFNTSAPDARGKVATNIALSIISKGHYNYKEISDNVDIVSALSEDGIIYYDNRFEIYRFSHDVYQEIIVKHYLTKLYKTSNSTKDFFDNMGDSYIIRKIFRSWLNDQIITSYSDTHAWISDILLNSFISHIWKDEILIILLGTTNNLMFSLIEHYLCADNFCHVDRTAVLLNTTCRIVNTKFLNSLSRNNEKIKSNIYWFTMPFGTGWNNFISFVWRYKEVIPWSKLLIIHIGKVLQAWTQNNKEGESTKEAGLLALFLCRQADNHNNIYLDRDTKELLYHVISLSGYEIYNEIDNLFEQWVKERSENHSYFEDILMYILSDTVTSFYYCNKAPQMVIKWASSMWIIPPQKDYSMISYSFDLSNECSFGINYSYSHNNHYSAYYTPVLSLLRANPHNTLSFIIDFINKTTENFYNSENNHRYYRVNLEPVYISENTVINQYCHEILWNAYRGFSNAPALYCNIHMALEKWLYETINLLNQENAVSLCQKILSISKSVSITSVLVSMVLAYPEKLFPICCILMRTKCLFELDTNRLINENYKINFLNHGINSIFKDERQQSNGLPYRKKTLEDVVWQYQMFCAEGESQEHAAERANTIQTIIDTTFGEYDKLEHTEQFLLCRIDKRRQTITISEFENGIQIETNPKLTDEQKEYQHNIQQNSEQRNKEAGLILWLYAHIDGKIDDYKNYPQYEGAPLLVMKELVNAASNNNNSIINEHTFVEFACVILCDFSNVADKYLLMLYTRTIKLYFYSAISQRRIGADVYLLKALIKSLSFLFNNYSNWDKVSLRNPIFIILGLMLEQISLKEILHEIKTSLYKKHKDIIMLMMKLYVYLAPSYHNEVSKGSGISPQQFYRVHRKNINIFLKNGGKNANIDMLSENEKIILLISLPFECHVNSSKIASTEISICKTLFAHDMYHPQRNIDLDFYFIENTAQNIYQNPRCVHTQNILNCLGVSHNTQYFLSDVLAYCQKDNVNDFWYLWNLSFDCIANQCSSQNVCETIDNFCEENTYYNNFDSIFKTYMFSQFINVKAFIELISSGQLMLFFSKCICKVGFHPAVLYSLAKVIHDTNDKEPESNFKLIYNVINTHHSLSHTPLFKNTIFLLEEFIQRYISQNRSEIKENPNNAKKVATILDFLVEKGSTVAYLLRDSIC